MSQQYLTTVKANGCSMYTERPTNVTGVPLTISVIDSNGNYRTIGETTSDSKGDYSFSWLPDITAQYNVYVKFA